MGSYATTTSLDTLTIGTNFDTATTSVATKCITWAEDEINKMLSKRYDVSTFVTTTPPLIISLSEQLALGYFYRMQSRGSKESLSRAKTMIDGVMDNLKELVKGKMEIVDTSGSLVTKRSGRKGVLENTSGYAPTFAEDDPLDWGIDQDKLDDIESDRD